MRIRSFSHVGITVRDFEKAVRWYGEVFGFKLIAEEELSPEKVRELRKLYKIEEDHVGVKLGFLRAPKGGVIEIFQFSSEGEARGENWNYPGLTHFTLDIKDIERWHDRLRTLGVEVITQPQKTGGNEWMFLKDPDGNLIELIDLKMNYGIIRILGGIAGSIMKKTKFKKYYTGG